jgi:hypothetical protein
MSKHRRAATNTFTRTAALAGGAAVIATALSIGSLGAAATASAKGKGNPVSHLGHVLSHAEKQLGKAGTNALKQTGTALSNGQIQTGTALSNGEIQVGEAGNGLLAGIGGLLGNL